MMMYLFMHRHWSDRTADRVLAEDGCLNFFAGPVDKELSATTISIMYTTQEHIPLDLPEAQLLMYMKH